MVFTTTNIEKTIKIIENLKNSDYTVLTLWFENDYVIEINKKDLKAILYEFEPCTEHYNYKGEYITLFEDIKKGYIRYGRKHKFEWMDIE